MCLAVPVKIVEMLDNELVKCQMGESQSYITASTVLIEEVLQVNDYLIVHAGFALRKLTIEDAEDTLALLREMAEAAQNAPF